MASWSVGQRIARSATVAFKPIHSYYEGFRALPRQALALPQESLL